MRMRAAMAIVALVAGLLYSASPVVAGDVDCSDFSTQAAAQDFFDANSPSTDPHGLDSDGDGVACESLPCPCSTGGEQPPPPPEEEEPPPPEEEPEEPTEPEPDPLRLVATPERVVVASSDEPVDWEVHGLFWSTHEWCGIDMVHAASGDWVDGASLEEGDTFGTLEISDILFRPGRHDVTLDCSTAGTATDSVVAKLGTLTSLPAARRDGRRVELRGTVSRWSWGQDGYGSWRGARVLVQRRGSTGWRTVREVESGRRGVVEVTVRSRRAARWRLVVAETSRSWSSRSRALRR